MRKYIFSVILAFGSLLSLNVTAQESAVVLGSEQSLLDQKSLFYGVTGIMVYNVYLQNNSILELFDANAVPLQESLQACTRQMNVLEFLIKQVNKELAGEGEFVNLKKSELSYLKELKKALVVLRNHAESAKASINSESGARAKFKTYKDQSWRLVSSVMNKNA